MLKSYSSVVMERLRGRFARLYGDSAANACLERLAMLMGRYGIGLNPDRPEQVWSERSVFLIAYGDAFTRQGQHPLATLREFLQAHLQDVFSTVHILPFFPYSSDDGFAVIDYQQVDPELGTWSDIRKLADTFGLMFDLVLNHASARSAWFRDFVGGVAPGRHYFIEADPAWDLSAVVRPRALPLLHAIQTRHGTRHVWTTFSEDQVDLNFANPDVLFEFLDILFFYVAMGARAVRLDAIAYLWKEPGTPCIHLPQTHELVKLLRDVLSMAAPDVLLLTETNVPHPENVSYFGQSDEAHMVYQFSLPPLLLHALQTGNGSCLTRWAAALAPPPPGCTFLNFTASHDGIGVRPLQGLIPDDEFDALVAGIEPRGGQVATKRNSDGSESPYELNITYFDALGKPGGRHDTHQLERFLCSQTIPLALQGIPAIYYNSLFGARNNVNGMKQTRRARTLNRGKWKLDCLERLLKRDNTHARRIFEELARRVRIRIRQPAFSPEAPQAVIDLGPELFAVERTAPSDGQRILCISNLTSKHVETSLPKADSMRDLLVNASSNESASPIGLAPYQTRWLTRGR